MSDKVHYWSELAELTHETQVMEFGWCSCEDNEGRENPYTDCPTELSENDKNILQQILGLLQKRGK
jgi:hypothetical protein